MLKTSLDSAEAYDPIMTMTSICHVETVDQQLLSVPGTTKHCSNCFRVDIALERNGMLPQDLQWSPQSKWNYLFFDKQYNQFQMV